MSLIDSWPRPSVGQHVRLHTGVVVEVVMVRGAIAVLKTLTETVAYALTSRGRATYGKNWLDVYYVADVIARSGTYGQVEPSQVKEILGAA